MGEGCFIIAETSGIFTMIISNQLHHVLLVAFALPLVPPPVELYLVHRPHGALHIFHPGETFVETQIVTDGVLRKILFVL